MASHICPSCGAKASSKEGTPAIASFCSECGAFLEVRAVSAESSTPPQKPSPAVHGWDSPNKLALYKMFFDLWTKTRDERTDYNKYFTNLLFISTLVAIVLAVIGAGASTTVLFSGFTMMLLAATFLAAAIISLVWYYKLQALWILYGSQRRALETIELDLALPSQGIHAIVANEQPFGAIRKYRWALTANYYGLPLAFSGIFFVLFAIFLILAIIALFNPSILPFLPGLAHGNNTTANATLNATVNASRLAQ